MRIFYEAASNRFWIDGTFPINAIPVERSVELSEQEYADLLAASIAAGGNPGPDANGRPIVVVPDWRADVMARLEGMRDRLIDATTSMQADYQADGDAVNAKICRDIKAQLKTITSDPAIVAATTRAAFRTALRARLNAIGSAAPLDVRDALKQAAAAA